MALNERIRIRSGALDWRLVEGEVVALDVRASRYLGLNETGTALWPLLIAGTELDDLVAHLRSTFGVDEATARADVAAFVSALRSRDLLE
jgi:hypothetical protein